MALVEPIHFVSRKGRAIVIRSAQPEDAQKTLDSMVEIAATSPFILSTSEDFKKRKLEDQKAWIEKKNLNEGSLFLIALDGDKVVGSADFASYQDSKRNHRGSLGVSIHHEYRSEGIGKKLMDVLIGKASQFPKIQFIELDVMEVNQPAFEMYLKLGFRVLNKTPQAFQLSDGKMVDNILMRFEVKK